MDIGYWIFRTAVGGYKITYSGDTRPNNQLVDIGRLVYQY